MTAPPLQFKTSECWTIYTYKHLMVLFLHQLIDVCVSEFMPQPLARCRTQELREKLICITLRSCSIQIRYGEIRSLLGVGLSSTKTRRRPSVKHAGMWTGTVLATLYRWFHRSTIGEQQNALIAPLIYFFNAYLSIQSSTLKLHIFLAERQHVVCKGA